MRVTLAAAASDQPNQRRFDIPVTVLVRSARGASGEYSYSTDSYTLSRLLRRKTELPGTVVDTFIRQLKFNSSARLPGVELNDSTLREIGYLTD